ncbi:MAG: hypothetical protein WC346_08325 [Methanogenium sp.]|jgi:hypothetical protein
MEYSHLLHSPFKKENTRFRAFLDAFLEVMEELRQTSEDYADEYSITESTLLDKWGIDLDLPRLTDETDASYRARLLDVYDGKGVTKEDLESLVNGVLSAHGYNDAQIHEFFDDLDFDLDEYEFRIELPVQVKYGVFEQKAFIGFKSTTERSYKEPWLASISSVMSEMGVEEIKRIINKFKLSGTKFKTTYGGTEV